LLVTVNNRLILEIEIVHDLSCHPIDFVCFSCRPEVPIGMAIVVLPKIRLRLHQTSSQLNAEIVVPNEEPHVCDDTSEEVHMSDATQVMKEQKKMYEEIRISPCSGKRGCNGVLQYIS